MNWFLSRHNTKGSNKSLSNRMHAKFYKGYCNGFNFMPVCRLLVCQQFLRPQTIIFIISVIYKIFQLLHVIIVFFLKSCFFHSWSQVYPLNLQLPNGCYGLLNSSKEESWCFQGLCTYVLYNTARRCLPDNTHCPRALHAQGECIC